METRILRAAPDGTVTRVDTLPRIDEGWVWVDVVVEGGEMEELHDLLRHLDFDLLALRDAVDERDLPKVDDFGHFLLIVLAGLRDDDIDTYEVDCFLAANHLVTVHGRPSPALDALWAAIQESPALARGGADDVTARLADVLTRRLLSVLEAFDERADELVGRALDADPDLVGELTAVRGDLSAIRRVVHPQREVLDLLRTGTSPLIDAAARRRFSDVFDVASRAVAGLDAARTALAEILDAYRGAEAREATDVTKVLTIYAAIMLPLSLVAGFFGMNFPNLPWVEWEYGWVVVTAVMVGIAVLSLGIFVGVGWMRRPSGRAAGAVVGRGLIEAARAPAQIVGAVYEVSTMPIRAAARKTGAERNQGD